MASEPVYDNAASSQPVDTDERLVTLDFIRGIAVLGILVANIVAYSQPHVAYSWPGGLTRPMNTADTAVWLVQFLLIDGKMRGLFTLLFGAGMALFMDRAWARGQTRWLQARRLLWLGAFGLAHFFFLFWGDILFLYAEAGLIVLPFVGMASRQLRGIGVVWYVVGSFYLAAPYVGVVLLEESPAAQRAAPQDYRTIEADWAGTLKEAGLERAAYQAGSYRAELRFIAEHRAPQLFSFPWFAVFETIPLMLIGIALYRDGLFAGGFDPAALRRWGWAGLGVGMALSLPLALWAMRAGFPPFLSRFAADDATQIPHLVMILGYVALLVSWAPRAARTWLGARLVAAGRMAFSNYIGTSLIMMLVFRHWALGFYGELSRVQLLGPMLLGWVLILAWSKPWFARFHYGPLEWCWRCLTYWRLFPLKR